MNNIDTGKGSYALGSFRFPGGFCLSPVACFSHCLNGNNGDSRPSVITVLTGEGVSGNQPDTLGKPRAAAAHGGGLLGGQAGRGWVVRGAVCVCMCVYVSPVERRGAGDRGGLLDVSSLKDKTRIRSLRVKSFKPANVTISEHV